jgi:hypothetical protein
VGATSLDFTSGTRASGRRRLATVVMVIALAGGCAPGTSSPAPATSSAPSGSVGAVTPGAAAASQAPSTQVPGAVAAPPAALDAVRDLVAPITSITWSEDATSPFAAVVEVGPNGADLVRLELYRATDGSIGTVVGYDATGRQVVITFDPDGRPVAGWIDDGTRIDVGYTASDAEVTVTLPDGTTERQTAPLALGPGPAGGDTMAHAGIRTVAAERVRYTGAVWTAGTVDVKTTRTDGKTIPAGGVLYDTGGCVSPDGDVECFADVVPLADGARVTVTSVVTDRTPGAAGQEIWRTSEDCDAARSARQTNWRAAGSGLTVGGAARAIGSRIMGVRLSRWNFALITTVVMATALTISWYPARTAESCGTVPDLEKIGRRLLDARDQSTVAVTVGARPATPCSASTATGLRIKKPTSTVTLSPFIPSHRSAVSATRPIDQAGTGLPALGSVAFSATGCPITMTGPFDAASLAKATEMDGSGLDSFRKLLRDNSVELLIEPPQVPGGPSPVTGEFTFSLVFPDDFLWGIQNSVGQEVLDVSASMPPEWVGCEMTIRFAGKMTGTNTVHGAVWIADGTGSATSSGTLTGCEKTSLKVGTPVKLRGITWLLKGDATKMDGRLLVPDPGDGSPWNLKVALKARP